MPLLDTLFEPAVKLSKPLDFKQTKATLLSALDNVLAVVEGLNTLSSEAKNITIEYYKVIRNTFDIAKPDKTLTKSLKAYAGIYLAKSSLLQLAKRLRTIEMEEEGIKGLISQIEKPLLTAYKAFGPYECALKAVPESESHELLDKLTLK